jgi:Fic family protein
MMPLKTLPPDSDIETLKILKQLSKSSRALAELKGITRTIPNSEIIINTLILQEAKDSSEIENIITTQDELYKASIDFDAVNNATKEVSFYSSALKHGFELIKQNQMLTINNIVNIQKILEQNDAGIRTQAGTVLKNEQTGEIVHTPPQEKADIDRLLKNLELYINIPDDTDPLIKMAIIHYQFESIHPFYDGNGRTGRIINILYLVLNELLDIPILYLSRYINRSKAEYYRLLQLIRNTNSWEEWIIYMLVGIEVTAKHTVAIILKIQEMMTETKELIKEKVPKIYSKELLEQLFMHPYTKIEFITDNLGVHRGTASRYLNALCEIKILEKKKVQKANFYINTKLYDYFENLPELIPQVAKT